VAGAALVASTAVSRTVRLERREIVMMETVTKVRPAPATATPVEVRAGDLGTLLTRVIAHADASKWTMPALSVVRLEAAGEWLFVVATDRYSFAIARQFTGLAGENPPEWVFDMPLKTARELIDRWGPAALDALTPVEGLYALEGRLAEAVEARDATLRLTVTNDARGRRLTAREVPGENGESGGKRAGRWSWLDAHDLTCKGRRTGALCVPVEPSWNPSCGYGRVPDWRKIVRRVLDGRLDENGAVYATQDRMSRWAAPYSMNGASWWPVLVDGEHYQVVASGDDMIGIQHVQPSGYTAPTTWDRVRNLWTGAVTDDAGRTGEVAS
jgi:hypothetical protein